MLPGAFYRVFCVDRIPADTPNLRCSPMRAWPSAAESTHTGGAPHRRDWPPVLGFVNVTGICVFELEFTRPHGTPEVALPPATGSSGVGPPQSTRALCNDLGGLRFASLDFPIL